MLQRLSSELNLVGLEKTSSIVNEKNEEDIMEAV